MASLDELITDADFHLENNRYAAARDCYRKAALLEVPDAKVLANLTVAEDEDRLEFRRLLSSRYAGAHNMLTAEAMMLVSLDRPHPAVRIYTRILQAEDLTSRESVLVRFSRFRAAVRAMDYDTLADDFQAVWDSVETIPAAKSLRGKLLRGLSQLDREEAIELLESLAERIPDLRIFLETKIQELRFMSVVLRQFGIPPSDT